MKHEVVWIGLVSMPLTRKTKAAVVELRDVTAQKTLDRKQCQHRHRSSRSTLIEARLWARDLNQHGVGL